MTHKTPQQARRRKMRRPGVLGILRRTRGAVNGWHLRTPALAWREYAKRRTTFEVDLPLFLARKRELAFERRKAMRSKEESGRYLTLKMKAAPGKEPPRSFNDERRT
jgi:hypothetical protein